MHLFGLEKGHWNVFAKTNISEAFRPKQTPISSATSWRPRSQVNQLIMRINVTFLTILILGLQVQAKTGYAQAKITLQEKAAPLEKILDEVHKQTGLSYAVQDQYLGAGHPVTISVKDASVREVLDIAFKDQPYAYEIVDQIIVVKKKEATSSPQPTKSDPAKTVKVQGSVYNESGEPLAGANIIIKETDKGTITNSRGEFNMSMVQVSSTVVVSFIGYAPQQFKVKDEVNVKIYLKVAKNELDKVVIQAYGTTTERLNTGSIATVTAAEIERQPIMNPLTALEGKVPGLVVTQVNGYASAPFKVELRGRSVIDPLIPSEPLYIIDGVPITILETGQNGSYSTGSVGVTQNGFLGPANGQSPLFSVNPSDIESISVLKDADATAIYGSRGANGVIIITTKKGKAGKTKMDMNVYEGESEVTQHFSMMNTQQYLQMRREAFKNDNITPNAGSAYDLLTWDTTRYTDWQKVLWGGMGHTTDAQLGVSGGDKQTTFRIGGGYHRETSILSRNGAEQRGSVQFNLTHKSLDQRLMLSFTNLYSYAQSNLVYVPGAVTLAPDAPSFFTPSGQVNWDGWGLQAQELQGLVGPLLQTYVAKTGFLNSELKVQYEILKEFHFTTQLGYSTTHNSQLGEQPIKSQNPASSPFGESQFGNNNQSNIIVEPQLVYNERISKGKLEVLGGGSFQSVSLDGNLLEGGGYTNDNLLGSIGNAGTKNAFDIFQQYRYAAVFGRVNYNWEDKYILNLSARRDGSSRFGPGKQFGNFGAVGAAWIFTEEGWFKDHLSVLSFGKIRGSYGITGSDAIGNYQYLSQWSGTNWYPYNGTPALVPTLLNNENLQWQTNRKLEGAMTLGFLSNNMITAEVAFYRDRSGNQLVGYVLPYLTGFNQITANLPATVQNTGWETTLRAKIVEKKNFTWSVNANIGINRNKLIAFPGLAQSPYASAFVIGKPLNNTRLLHYTGVDPITGQYTFEDKNHNGVVDPFYNNNGKSNDLYLKDLSIKYEGGFGTDLRYKEWQLNMFFRFRGQDLLSSLSDYPGTAGNNQSTELLNRWQKPGDKARFARYTTLPQNSDNYFYSFSDGVYSNGSYLRLQNVSVSYDLPGPWIQRIGMQACRIYARGQNLFLLTKYNGIDPDTPSFGALPPAKLFTGGIQFTF